MFEILIQLNGFAGAVRLCTIKCLMRALSALCSMYFACFTAYIVFIYSTATAVRFMTEV